MANKPTNPQLYSRVKAEAKKKFDRWPSAYGSSWLVKTYKERGGGYRKAQEGMEIQDSVSQLVNDMRMMAMGGIMYRDNMFDDGGEMALGQIAAVTDKMSKLQQFLKPDAEVEPWIASKLAIMDDSAGAIYDYMMYNPEAQEEEGETEEPEEMEEMRNGGIPNRYKNMGFNKVGVKKQSTRPGKKWMVLAKKGDQYKVVHGGYKGMKDFTQHGSQKRRDRFWDRMGGRNSAKATNPFSPLYWHKRFGTWAEGGEPQNEGFQALPQEVQAKIMANMMYGGDMYGMGGMPCYKCGGTKYAEGGEWFNEDSQDFYRQGGIKIDPAKKGTFKAQATRMGMSVQEAAEAILKAPKGKYTPEMRRKANFAKNFAKEYGGMMEYQMGGSGMGNMYMNDMDFDMLQAGLPESRISPDLAAMREYQLNEQEAPAGFVSDIPAPAKRGAGSGMGNMYMDQMNFDMMQRTLPENRNPLDIATMEEYQLDEQEAPTGFVSDFSAQNRRKLGFGKRPNSDLDNLKEYSLSEQVPEMQSVDDAQAAYGPQNFGYYDSPLYFTQDSEGNAMEEGEYRKNAVPKDKLRIDYGNLAYAALDAFSNLSRQGKEKKQYNQFRRQLAADQMYALRPQDLTGNRGDYDTFGNFRPNEVGAWKPFTQQSFARQRGGEIELTDSQIRQLVALGAEIEILD